MMLTTLGHQLRKIDAMEEDQEVTSCFQAGFTMGELQSSAIPNSVIPSNVRFLSYENMKRSVTCSPAAMQHPWVKGAFPSRVSSARKIWTSSSKSISSRRRIVSWGASSPRISHHHPRKERHNHMGMGTPLGNCQAWGSAPVSYHHHTSIFTIFLSSILFVISWSSRINFSMI